ncbi:MAG: hypothetical protein SFU85_08975 [Candidatus Methylacidiphilales bacterium]|nr:hypothetical protein [Candidatus Methylacidiphilales bacterium]
MTPVRAAVIDLGSNSVKVLLAEQRGSTLHVHREDAHTTRLGDRLALTGKLSAASIRGTLDVLATARSQAEEFGATSIHIVGTSALRSAANARAFLDPARAVLGRPVRVITGAAEARYAYAGISSSAPWRKGRLLALDLGGGSLEFVLGRAGRMEKARSLPIGCVRLRDLFLRRQPVSARALAEARAWLLHGLRSVLPWSREKDTVLVGCGGTMITLAALHLDPGKRAHAVSCDGLMVPTPAIAAWLHDLAGRRVDSIKTLAAIPPARADVITAGILVFHTIAEAAGATHMGCAIHGLRYGLWQLEIAPEPFHHVVHEAAA